MSRLRLARLFLAAGCALSASAARTCYAQNPAAAEALFEQARAAMAAGSFDIACARFRDSDKLDPAVGTRFNLADCEERRGRIATAWSLFRGVLSELAEDDDRRPIAQARAKALEPRMPYLTLLRAADTPADVHVRVDGVELGEASFGLSLPMDPGAHDLTLAFGQPAQEQTSNFVLKEGERRSLPLSTAAGAAASGSSAGGEPAPAAVASTDAAEPISARRRWGYIVGGVGAGGVLFGAATGIVTLSKKSTANANCSDDRHVCNREGVDANDSGKTFAMLSGVGFGVGVVGLAAGAYLLLTSRPSAPAAVSTGSAHPSIPSGAALTVSPTLTFAPGTGFLSLAGSF